MNQPLVCHIRLQGTLNDHWAERLAGLTLANVGREAILTGRLPDQTAFYGLLNQLRDLGVTLLVVHIERIIEREYENNHP